MTNKNLTGLVALVTGATQGIGRAIAIRLAQEGCKVAVNGRFAGDKIDRVVAETSGMAAVADINKPKEVAEMVKAVSEQLGPIEILIANAAQMTMSPILKQDPAEWWKQINVNLTGHIDCIHNVLPNMKDRRRGKIVIISSNFGVIGWANATGYAASKSGLNALGCYFASELADYGININIIAPGVIDTPQLQVDADDLNMSLEEVHDYYAKSIPMGRIGRAEEVAGTVAFLAGRGGQYLSGRLIQINGGETRCSSFSYL